MPEAKNHGVNWDRALDLLQRSITAGGDTQLQNDFIAECLPMAEMTANAKARQYAGSNLAVEIDKDECNSAALQGLWEVARKTKLTGKPTPEKLRNLCATVISRRFVDLERNKMGRHTRKVRPHSLDETIVEGDVRNVTRNDGLLGRQDYGITTDEAVDNLLGRLERLLPEEQFQVMRAVITMRPKGHTADEIAATLGKSPSTVASTISHVRKKLNRVYPEVEAEMIALLSEAMNDTRGPHRATTRTL